MAFFSTTALGPRSPAFRGRAAELARLARLCREEVTRYGVVYGGRQNGKTSLLFRLLGVVEQPTRLCRIDFQQIQGATPDRVFALVAEQIDTVVPLGRDLDAITSAPRLKARLSEALARPEVGRLVLMLDELGALTPPSREALGNALRSFFHDRLVSPPLQKLLVIFSGGIELYTMVVSEVSSLHNVCEEIYLPDLLEPEAVALIADGLQAAGVAPALSEQLGRAVYGQVSGHPYLTQRMGELLASYHATGATLSPAAVTRAAGEIVAEAPPLLRHIRDDLHLHQLEDAARRLLRDRPRFSRLDDELVRLELIGLGKRDGAFWAPRNPLLAAVFRERLGVPAPEPVVPQRPPDGASAAHVLGNALAEPVPAPEPDPLSNASARRQPTPEPEAPAVTRKPEAADPSLETSRRPTQPTPVVKTDRLAAELVDPNWRTGRTSVAKRPASSTIPASTIIRALLLIVPLIAIAAWFGLSRMLGGPTDPTLSASAAVTSPAVAAPAGQAATPGPSPTASVPAWAPDLVEIPAGSFLMGSADTDTFADADEKPQHTLELARYWIGRTEVTNAQFRQFVEDGGYAKQEYWTAAGWAWREENSVTQPRYWDDPAWNSADHPVVGVSWFEAVAYVRWLSARTGHAFRLPTEAEWEKAARGADGRIWPWGNEWIEGQANSAEEGQNTTTAVGGYSGGASPYGALDMAGNAWEWCATERGKRYPYQLEDEWADAYLERDAIRVLRGGALLSEQQYVRGADRYSTLGPRARYNFIGFRVVSHASMPGSDS